MYSFLNVVAAIVMHFLPSSVSSSYCHQKQQHWFLFCFLLFFMTVTLQTWNLRSSKGRCAELVCAGPAADSVAMHHGTSFLSEAILELAQSKASSAI